MAEIVTADSPPQDLVVYCSLWDILPQMIVSHLQGLVPPKSGETAPEEPIHHLIIPVMLPCGVSTPEARLKPAVLAPLTILARGNALLAQ